MKVPISVLRYIVELETARVKDVINRCNTVNKERAELNKQIRMYYEPLLRKAGKEQDKEEFKQLLSELPDCPFFEVATKIGGQYFKTL